MKYPPLTCIMPTRGRRLWARQAVDCFLAQDYPDRMLVVLDDADDLSFPDPFDDLRIVHVTLKERYGIAAKRNLATEIAMSAELIAAWDSDDICDPRRLSTQVKTLLASGKAVTGYCTMIFIDEANRRAGRYTNARNYALGTSLLYTRAFWESHRFNENLPGDVAEDYEFVSYAWSVKQLESVEGDHMIYARVHPDNSSVKYMEYFDAVDWDTLSPNMMSLMLSQPVGVPFGVRP